MTSENKLPPVRTYQPANRNIRVSEATRRRLFEQKHVTESYDDVINRILDKLEAKHD